MSALYTRPSRFQEILTVGYAFGLWEYVEEEGVITGIRAPDGATYAERDRAARERNRAWEAKQKP